MNGTLPRRGPGGRGFSLVQVIQSSSPRPKAEDLETVLRVPRKTHARQVRWAVMTFLRNYLKTLLNLRKYSYVDFLVINRNDSEMTEKVTPVNLTEFFQCGKSENWWKKSRLSILKLMGVTFSINFLIWQDFISDLSNIKRITSQFLHRVFLRIS